MTDISLFYKYLEWFIILGLTILLFYIVSKKTKSLWKLLLFVILPIWIIVSARLGIENLINQRSEGILHFFGFILLMAETTAPMIIFGIIPFTIMYKRLKKNNT